MVDAQILIAYHWRKHQKRKAKKKAAAKKKKGKKGPAPTSMAKAMSVPISQPVTKKTNINKTLKEKKSAPLAQKNDKSNKPGFKRADTVSPPNGGVSSPTF